MTAGTECVSVAAEKPTMYSVSVQTIGHYTHNFIIQKSSIKKYVERLTYKYRTEKVIKYVEKMGKLL